LSVSAAKPDEDSGRRRVKGDEERRDEARRSVATRGGKRRDGSPEEEKMGPVKQGIP
jgi:hypothetical protein